MIRVRHEEYDSFTGALPFSLGLNLERTPHNCSQEQNWHENLELQHITYGNGTVLLDGKAYSVKPGDICLVNSNEIHYTYTDTKLRYNCLIIEPHGAGKWEFTMSPYRFHLSSTANVLKKC